MNPKQYKAFLTWPKAWDKPDYGWTLVIEETIEKAKGLLEETDCFPYSNCTIDDLHIEPAPAFYDQFATIPGQIKMSNCMASPYDIQEVQAEE